jgi:outer membrane scaffolding protein for murein synthesis (MipA/OmpV family)
VSTEAEVGVTYPMTEHWVLRATIKHNFLPDAVKDSPLYDDNSATSFLTSFSYVF